MRKGRCGAANKVVKVEEGKRLGVRQPTFLGNGKCRNLSGIFVVHILEEFARDFPGGFSGHVVNTNMRR